MSLHLVNIHGEIEGDYDIVANLTGLTNGEVLMKIYGLSEEDIDVGTFSVYVYMKDKQTIIVSVDWWNSKWGE